MKVFYDLAPEFETDLDLIIYGPPVRVDIEASLDFRMLNSQK